MSVYIISPVLNSSFTQVVETYRSKLCDDLPGPEGEEIARQRIERFANSIRPETFVVCRTSSDKWLALTCTSKDPIRVISVDLGCSAPRLSC